MVSRPKWKQNERNLQVGDIGHIKYDSKVSKATWRLARIEKADEDEDGRVRTILVSFRPRHVADKRKAYHYKEPQTLEIGVQRFAVLLAKEEQETLSQTLQTEN